MSGQLPRDDSKDERFSAFLREKGVKLQCPACGSGKVELDEAAGFEPAIPYARTLGFKQFPAAALPAYVLVCRECGHIRLFDRSVVDGV